MLTPEWLAGCAEPLRALYLEAAADVLDEMAKRIAAYDFYIPAAQYQEEKLKQMGLTRQTVQKELKKRTAKTEEELRRLMKEGAALALSRGYAGEGRARPQTMSEPMKKLLQAAYRQTAGLLENITKTTANTASRQLEHALDLAWMEVSSGAMSPQEASRKAIKRLASQGLSAVSYPSGKTDSLTTAVTRAVRTGVNQGALQIALQDAKELGCDLVEVTAHAGARPDHALWQGKVYSISGKTEGYPKLSTATGYGTGAGLGGWNCRHSFFPYAEGSSKSYTDEELKKLENEAFMTYRGKTLTRGEADAMKQNIRSAKEKWTLETSMLHAAKLDAAQAEAYRKKWIAQDAEFTHFYQQALQRLEDAKHTYGDDGLVAKLQEDVENLSERDIIKIQRIKEAGHLPDEAVVHLTPTPIDVESFVFDAYHVTQERNRPITREMAVQWIKEAKFSVTVWDGQSERYYSENGAAYVLWDEKTIRTAFLKETFDDRVKAMLKEVDK